MEEGREGWREAEAEEVGGGGLSGEGRLLAESGDGGRLLGGKAAALGTGRHRRRRGRRRGREGKEEEGLEREAGGVPAEGGSIGVHRHPASEAWGSPEKKIWEACLQESFRVFLVVGAAASYAVCWSAASGK